MKKWAILFLIGVGLLVPIGILEDIGGHKNLADTLGAMAIILGITGIAGYLFGSQDSQ